MLTIGLLLDIGKILLSHLEEQRDGSGLDGNTTVLFILTGVGETGLTSTSGRNNTGLGDEGIGKGGLSVIDVSNNGHVTNVRNLVHLLKP